MVDPQETLAVAKTGHWDQARLGSEPQFGINAATAMVTSGPGKYAVINTVQFQDKDNIHQLYLVVYAAEKVEIHKSSTSPEEMSLAMVGPTQQGEPCDTVTIDGFGVFTRNLDKLIGGVPTFWAVDKEMFAYFALTDEGYLWMVIHASEWDRILAGELWSV